MLRTVAKPLGIVNDAGGKEVYRNLHRKPEVFEIGGNIIVGTPGVYHPFKGSSTDFFLNNAMLHKYAGARVLDIGCGSGAIGLSMARNNHVFLSDIDDSAIRTARANVLLNDLEPLVAVLHGDVWEPVGGSLFDLVLFNLPYWHKPFEDAVDTVSCDPGGKVFTKFIAGLDSHLSRNGKAIITYSNLADIELFLNNVQLYNFDFVIIGSETDGNCVTRWLIEITRV